MLDEFDLVTLRSLISNLKENDVSNDIEQRFENEMVDSEVN